MLAAGSPQRGVLAWLGAWAAITLLGRGAEQLDAELGGGDWAPSMLGVWTAPAAFAFFIWIPFARARKWLRPLTDIVLFAIGAAVLPLFVFFFQLLQGVSSLVPTTHMGIRFLGGMSGAEYALYIAQVAMAFGIGGGVLYWLFAGRPHAPYESAGR